MLFSPVFVHTEPRSAIPTCPGLPRSGRGPSGASRRSANPPFPVVHPISLQLLTKCSFRKSFALTTIHFHGGCTPLFPFYFPLFPVSSRGERSQGALCERKNRALLRTNSFVCHRCAKQWGALLPSRAPRFAERGESPDPMLQASLSLRFISHGKERRTLGRSGGNLFEFGIVLAQRLRHVHFGALQDADEL
jgi:hypothetical protein